MCSAGAAPPAGGANPTRPGFAYKPSPFKHPPPPPVPPPPPPPPPPNFGPGSEFTGYGLVDNTLYLSCAVMVTLIARRVCCHVLLMITGIDSATLNQDHKRLPPMRLVLPAQRKLKVGHQACLSGARVAADFVYACDCLYAVCTSSRHVGSAPPAGDAPPATAFASYWERTYPANSPYSAEVT